MYVYRVCSERGSGALYYVLQWCMAALYMYSMYVLCVVGARPAWK